MGPWWRRCAPRGRWFVAAATVLVVLLTAGLLLRTCEGRKLSPRTFENAVLISYAGIADRLGQLPASEREEQIRDWARFGLAAHLNLNTAEFRAASYDLLPIRDLAFADLSRQPTGPGRYLVDGRGVLHVLIPRDGPHPDRTIGLLIDQQRADAGEDQPRTQIHRYRIDPQTRTIRLTSEAAEPTDRVRPRHGYLSMTVDDPTSLETFLARTRYLSRLEVHGSQVSASGWNWPDVPARPLDREDVSVLQRAYLRPDGHPGFSLDPHPVTSVADVRAVVPSLSPALAAGVVSGDWRGSRFRSTGEVTEAVRRLLFDSRSGTTPEPVAGLPSDRTHLWALLKALTRRPAFSQARYDGGLEGTRIGMTLFYTDHIAKDWVSGVGDGVPARAVRGFVPDPDAEIPPCHCADTAGVRGESGRLWFGQNDAGFAYGRDQVTIGAQATRLFSRTNGAKGTEVQPSFGFGRGLRWWDQHYQAVADYEPQYQRLEQIMRWSGAIEWLVSRTAARLPQLDDKAITSTWTFANWYRRTADLRERSRLHLVRPPSATQEALLATPSQTYERCGLGTISGGVSLGDRIRRQGSGTLEDTTPPEIRRAGVTEGGSTVDPKAWSGQSTQVILGDTGHEISRLRRTFSTTTDGHAVVDVEGTGQRDNPFGTVEFRDPPGTPRDLGVELWAGDGHVSESVAVHGEQVGSLTARTGPQMVSLQWRPRLYDRVLVALERLQDRLAANPATGPPELAAGVLYVVRGPDGATVGRVGAPDQPWLSLDRDLADPKRRTALRLGVPPPNGGPPTYLQAVLSGEPPFSSPWMEVTAGTSDHAAEARPAGPPAPNARTLRVDVEGSGRGTGYVTGDDRFLVNSRDPVLGLHGSEVAAAFERDLPEVLREMQEAARIHGPFRRAVPLHDDGLALLEDGGVTLVPGDDPRTAAVQRAMPFDGQADGQPGGAWIAWENGRALSADPREPRPSGPPQRMSLSEALAGGGPIPASAAAYVRGNALRGMLVSEDAVIRWDIPKRDPRVTVQIAEATPTPGITGPVWQPEVRLYGEQPWYRVTPNTREAAGIRPVRPLARPPGPNPTATTTGPTTGSTIGPDAAVGAPAAVALICLDENEDGQCDD